MENKGYLRQWNEEKGFGFIRPDSGGPEIFVHASVVYGARRLSQGEYLAYVCATDDKGRLRATHVRFAGELSIDNPDIRRAPKASAMPVKKNMRRSQSRLNKRVSVRGYSIALICCLIPLLGCLQAFNSGHMWPVALYSIVSLATVMAYWNDKQSAQLGRWRTPESTLHLLELFGGWPGALLAQQWLRHKTSKTSFLLVFGLIVLMHNVFWFDYVFLQGKALAELLSVLATAVVR